MSRRMTAAETRALWSRVSPETWEAATRILVRLCEGKAPEPESPLDCAGAVDHIPEAGAGPATDTEET